MLIWAVELELLVLSAPPAQTQNTGKSQQVEAQPECVQTRGPGRRMYQHGLRPRLPLPAWQRGTLLIREFTQSQASPRNCYPQWQTTPFSLSVSLQFTLPPPLCAPAAHSARCHAALVACQQRLSWRINTSSAALQTRRTYTNAVCRNPSVYVFVSLKVEVCVSACVREREGKSARQRITR